jgi:hypothetical protein
METMQRATWTDERLDDLNRRVDSGFDRVDARFAQVDAEFRALRTEMNARFEAAQTRTDAQFASLHRLILQVGGGGIATMALGFVGLVVAHA